jgi:hypothetical protein
VLITGVPSHEWLLADYEGSRDKYRSAQERFDTLVNQRDALLKQGMRYTRVEVSLKPNGIEYHDDKVVLRATEWTNIYFLNAAVPGSQEEVTGAGEDHYFVFTRVPVSATDQPRSYSSIKGADQYVLVEDWMNKDPYGSSPAPNIINPDDTPEDYDDSTFCCYPEEMVYNQAVTDPSLGQYGYAITPQSCSYDGVAAAAYAISYANSYNGYYRRFDNDCTNFVSQSLDNATWGYKGYGRDYKNWGFWWYNPTGSQKKGQSRTWTQAKALKYFVTNSGRGFNTANPCELDRGDLNFADWNNDRNIEHVMIITNINCSSWSSIYLTQHSPSRLNKPLSQYQAEEPNAKFYAYWICHN